MEALMLEQVVTHYFQALGFQFVLLACVPFSLGLMFLANALFNRG